MFRFTHGGIIYSRFAYPIRSSQRDQIHSESPHQDIELASYLSYEKKTMKNSDFLIKNVISKICIIFIDYLTVVLSNRLAS